MMLAISCASDGSRKAEQATDSADVNLVLQNLRNRGQITAAIASTTVLVLSRYLHLIEDKILLIMAIVGVETSAALIQDAYCVKKQDKLCTSRFERLKAHFMGASLSIIPMLVAIMTSNTNQVKVDPPSTEMPSPQAEVPPAPAEVPPAQAEVPPASVGTNVQTSDQNQTTMSQPVPLFDVDALRNHVSNWYTHLRTNDSSLDGSESTIRDGIL